MMVDTVSDFSGFSGAGGESTTLKEVTTPQNEGSLIKPTAKEELMSDIVKMRTHKQTESEKKSVTKAIETYATAYRRLAEFWFCFKNEHLTKMSYEKKVILGDMIYNKAFRIALIQSLFLLPIILTGDCMDLVLSRRKLKKLYGDDFFKYVEVTY